VLNPALEGVDDGGLGRSVWPVEQNQLVDAPGASEIAERAIERILNFFLSGDANSAVVCRRVEKAKPPDLSARMRDLLDAEIVQRVAQVLGSVASLSARLL